MSDVAKTWVRVCPFDKLPVGQAIDLNINGQRLIIARCGDTASIMQGYCTHMLFPLSGSKIENCVLTCALHESSFDVRDGAVVDWSSYPPLVGEALAAIQQRKALRTFETRIDGGDVFVLWPTTDPDSVRIKV